MLKFSFYLSLLLLSLNQLTLLSTNGGLNMYTFDIFMGVFSFFGLMYFLAVKKSFKIHKYSILYILFSFYAGVTLLLSLHNFSQNENIASLSYLVRLVVYIIGELVVFNMVDKKMIDKEKVINAIILSGILISILGFIQILVLPDFSVLNPDLGWDPHKNRLASTFFDPNFVGAYLVLSLILLVEKLSIKKINGGKEDSLKNIYILLLILLIALFLTFSRSAWGMLAVVVLILGLFRSRFLLFAFFLLSFLVYFAIPRVQTRISGITDPADSASLRIQSWGNTIRIIKDNFWIGTGFNTFRYVQQEYGYLTPDTVDTHSGSGSDSSVLLVLATTGIAGFLIYLSAFLFPLLDSFMKKDKSWVVIACVILGLLVESQFINSLFYPQIMFVLFCILFVIPSRS